MLYAFIWCGLWGRQQWARQRMCRESGGEGVWSVNQNSNCNWSLTSIIAFNYIYLFARRLLSCPTCPSLPGSPLYHIPHGVVPCRCCWWRHDDDALPVPVPVPDSWPLVSAGDHVDWFRFDSHFIYACDLATSTILFHFISFHLSFFLLPPALLWLSCFIQQLMRKLAVVWIIYNSTHVADDNSSSRSRG